MWVQLAALAIFAIFGFTYGANDKIVCYYGSWAVYRQGKGRFDIEDIDPTLCTHLIYTFVGINADGSIRIIDSYHDIDQGGYRRFNALKSRNPSVKTLIAIGGWNEGSQVFSQVATSPRLRTAFVNNAVNFVRTHGFNGFDLDWEYPGQRGGASTDKINFGLLVKEMKAAFKQHGLLLTAAVGATANAIRLSYDVPTLSQNLDFINVMTYDLHGVWDKVTGENAPLHPAPHETNPAQKELNVVACINAWIKNGASPNKLVLGVGVYGRSFTLNNPANHGLAAPASQPGKGGRYTNEPGMLGYNEICELQKSGQWTRVWNDPQKVPYAYSGNQWVGYDDPQSVTLKVNYVKQMRLGGVMIWSIETDDFHGTCGSKYPILNTIKSNL